MTRLPLGLILWFLKTVTVEGSLPFLGISSSLGTLLDRIPDKSVSINIIYDETESLQVIQAGTLAHFIEHDLETPVILMGNLEVFWPIIRSQRMAWRGSVNIVLLGMDEKFAYLKQLHERFFTGFGLRIADERRMDLLYENIYHIFPFETWQSWTQSKLAIEELLEESLNLITVYPLNQLSPVKMGISWNKANSLGLNKLEQVNSWTESNGLLYKSYLVPLAVNTYSSLAGRHFRHPVMHKPPWNYVTLDQFDNFVEDNGGRDITLCHILAGQLGFTFEPIDPKTLGIARSRGSQWDTPDYNFSGILGKLHRREQSVHFYLGDTTQTYTRNSAVDFSFMVLADSGAFVSQAPSRFVPNDILIRPFSWPVWAFTLGSMVTVWLLLIMILQYGKCMYRNRDSGIIPYDGSTTLLTESLARSVAKTGFMIYRIFFHEPEMYFVEHNHPFLRPFRILTMGVMIVVGLVLLPSYNGSLFSFFYVPFFRKPLDSLPELHKMMQQANHTLGVTAGSSSFEIISTGGGIYNDLWREMEQQGNWLIPSVQEGLLQTLSDPTFSVFAGREKLIFDSLRLGGKDKLHINKEVFFTKYKAIAMRTGSPLKQPLNRLLHRLTDAGIIGKITQDEYNGLTKREGSNSQYWTEMYRVVISESADKEGARALGWTQFQGLFFITALGYSLALISFMIENFARLPPNIPKMQSKFRALKQIYIHGF